MKKHLFSSVVVILFALMGSQGMADIVVDVDPVTPGIQTSFSTTSPMTYTIPVFFDGTVSGPALINGVGVDINWTTTGGAIVTPMPATIFGGAILGITPKPFFSADMVAGTFAALDAGMPMAAAGLPSPIAASNLGSAAHFDAGGGTYGAGGSFSGPANLLGATFMISGPVGSTATFTPSGILAPSFVGAPPFVSGGFALQSGFTGGMPGPGIAQTFVPGTVSIVPEPSSFLLLGLVGLLFGTKKVFNRRSKKQS